MKIYELYGIRVEPDTGTWKKAQRIALIADPYKLEQKMAEFRAKNERGAYWMSWATDDNNHIIVQVNELEVEE